MNWIGSKTNILISWHELSHKLMWSDYSCPRRKPVSLRSVKRSIMASNRHAVTVTWKRYWWPHIHRLQRVDHLTCRLPGAMEIWHLSLFKWTQTICISCLPLTCAKARAPSMHRPSNRGPPPSHSGPAEIKALLQASRHACEQTSPPGHNRTSQYCQFCCFVIFMNIFSHRNSSSLKNSYTAYMLPSWKTHGFQVAGVAHRKANMKLFTALESDALQKHLCERVIAIAE